MMPSLTLRKAFTASALTLIALLFPASMIRMWGQDGREPIPVRTPKPEPDWIDGELRPIAAGDNGAGSKAEVVVEPPDVDPLPPAPSEVPVVQPVVDDVLNRDTPSPAPILPPPEPEPPQPPPLQLPPAQEAEEKELKRLRDLHPKLNLGDDPLPRMNELNDLAKQYDPGSLKRWAILVLKETDAIEAGRIWLALGATEERRNEFDFDSAQWIKQYLSRHLRRKEFNKVRQHGFALGGEPLVAAMYWEAVSVLWHHPDYRELAVFDVNHLDDVQVGDQRAFYQFILESVKRLQEHAGDFAAADFLIQRVFAYSEKQRITMPEKVSDALKERQRIGPQLRAAREYEDAVRRLNDHPFDRSLYHTAGLYECLVLGKWQQGLARLQKANRFAPHMALFQKEFDLDSANGLSLMELADSWADFAARDKTGLYAEQAKRRACEHYRRAATLLQDPIEKALAAKRAKDCCEDKAPVPKPVPKPASDPIVGTWDWQNPRGKKLVITFKANGTAKERADVTWRFDGVAPLGRRYKVRWGKFEDTMILNLAGRMEGTSDQGDPIQAVRRP